MRFRTLRRCGGGSNAVWNFSENSSVLVSPSVPEFQTGIYLKLTPLFFFVLIMVINMTLLMMNRRRMVVIVILIMKTTFLGGHNCAVSVFIVNLVDFYKI